jgi:hypothetical protein
MATISNKAAAAAVDSAGSAFAADASIPDSSTSATPAAL